MKLYLLLFLTVVVFTGCSSFQTYDQSTAEGAFKQAQEYEKFERYEEAIAHYQQVKSKFPYSRYAKQSDLKIADLNFKREAYGEAQISYQLYKEFYPRDPISDYVTYQIGLSYYNQLPSKVGRDLSVARDAVRYFDELLDLYPSSEFAKKAQEKKKESLELLANKELYVADFYFKQDEFSAALGRYEDVLKRYSNIGFNRRALLGAILSAHNNKNERKSSQYLNRLMEVAPGSKELDKAQKELRK